MAPCAKVTAPGESLGEDVGEGVAKLLQSFQHFGDDHQGKNLWNGYSLSLEDKLYVGVGGWQSQGSRPAQNLWLTPGSPPGYVQPTALPDSSSQCFIRSRQVHGNCPVDKGLIALQLQRFPEPGVSLSASACTEISHLMLLSPESNTSPTPLGPQGEEISFVVARGSTIGGCSVPDPEATGKY